MKTSTMGATIGAMAGGLLGYYLTRTAPWATIKKVAAVLAGAAGGGVIGYGIGRIPGESKYSMGGTYPEYRSSASIVQESAAAYPPASVVDMPSRRARAQKCARPNDELRGEMLQWVDLVQSGAPRTGAQITSSDMAYRYFRDAALSPQENFYVLMLDNKGVPVGHALVSRGSQTETIVNPSDVLRPALLSGATRIVVAHNHPSGDPAPSSADVTASRRVGAAGKEMGIPLLDSIVIGRGGYASLRDMGLIS